MQQTQEANLAQAYLDGLRPDPSLTVSEWSDQNRYLSGKAASEPGPWRTDRTPYLREIMDCLSPSSAIERIVLQKGAQIGGTECGNNWIGYVIHHTPGPMLAVLPTVEMAKRNSKQRIDPLIDESPELRRLVKPARSRDSGNTVLAKEFPGGVLVMTGANSAAGLRSMPVRFLFLDEVDGYPGDVDGEGDPIALAEARTRTFARRKIFIVSTPTIKNFSRIEREFEASDRRYFMLPCPSCGTHQWLKFEQLKWPKNQPEQARYECEHCNDLIEEHHKTWMLENGHWQAHAESDGKTAGFHISSLYSPVGWRSWVEIARAWLDAQGSDAAIKSFKNTELGMTYQETGETPSWERLYERRENWKIGNVPTGALFLTAGVDVQADRIEMSVWGWGREKESWLIEHRVLDGDTSRREVWHSLSYVLNEYWPHESGVELSLRRLAIDSGYATQEVYGWARKQAKAQVMVVKGVQRGAALVGLATAVETTIDGKKLKRGIRVRPVVGGLAKLELFNNLRKNPPTIESGDPYPAGYVHLPKVDEEYLRQLCSEQLVTTKNRRGYPVREWQKTRERNEALDCYVYARAAAAVEGLDRFSERHWREMERSLGLDEPTKTQTTVDETETGKPASHSKRRRVRSRGVKI
jgi:phage terminase large subunit GpA-like protein